METIFNVLMGGVLPLVLLIAAGYLIKNYRDTNVIKWVKIAVQAAEQIYDESGKGKEKFEYVKAWILDKFKISEIDLKNIIESAVYLLNTEKQNGGE